MTKSQTRQLSKFLSLILRHEPEKIGLILGDNGAVPLEVLLHAIQQIEEWNWVTEANIREVVETSDKQRFEIAGDIIRARYGHSVSEPVSYAEVEPPNILYHGTSHRALAAIQKDGLLPMQRQYVHLSITREGALAVGRRHDPNPVILIVQARAAWENGIHFYQPERRLFLADAVPPAHLQIEESG